MLALAAGCVGSRRHVPGRIHPLRPLPKTRLRPSAVPRPHAPARLVTLQAPQPRLRPRSGARCPPSLREASVATSRVPRRCPRRRVHGVGRRRRPALWTSRPLLPPLPPPRTRRRLERPRKAPRQRRSRSGRASVPGGHHLPRTSLTGSSGSRPRPISVLRLQPLTLLPLRHALCRRDAAPRPRQRLGLPVRRRRRRRRRRRPRPQHRLGRAHDAAARPRHCHRCRRRSCTSSWMRTWTCTCSVRRACTTTPRLPLELAPAPAPVLPRVRNRPSNFRRLLTQSKQRQRLCCWRLVTKPGDRWPRPTRAPRWNGALRVSLAMASPAVHLLPRLLTVCLCA